MSRAPSGALEALSDVVGRSGGALGRFHGALGRSRTLPDALQAFLDALEALSDAVEALSFFYGSSYRQAPRWKQCNARVVASRDGKASFIAGKVANRRPFTINGDDGRSAVCINGWHTIWITDKQYALENALAVSVVCGVCGRAPHTRKLTHVSNENIKIERHEI